MYRIMIVEDDGVQNAQIAKIVKAHFGVQALVECYCSAEQFYLRVPDHWPEIALLDIQLPGDSGIKLAAYLNETAPQCQIVYLTNFIDYASDVYHTKHVWFVTKNRAADTLPAALEEAREKLRIEQENILAVTLKDGLRMLPQSEILYLERKKRLTYIFTAAGVVSCAEPLDALAARLNPALFVRCHNSYIVSLRHIRYFRRTELQMSSGDIVSVSRQYHAALRDLLGRYISETALPVTGQ